MARAEIQAGNFKSPQECSIVEVGYRLSMNEEDIPDVGESVIFRVPKSLRKDDLSYSPHLVSIGPFHHGKEELRAMEMSKSEAVRRMQTRVQKNYPAVSIKSFVEHDLLLKDTEIRKFYVFDVPYQNPTRDGLMGDILLFENQIPLWVLKDILQIQMGSPQAAKNQLQDFLYFVLRCVNRQNIFTLILPCYYTACSHVLETFYLTMLGGNIGGYMSMEALQLPPSRNRLQIYLNKGVDSVRSISGRCLKNMSSSKSGSNVVRLKYVKLRTTSELMRAGVKIQAVTHEVSQANIGSAIQWIRFDENKSTLYLPQISVTPESYAVMSNFIAMEVSTKRRYVPNPMTQYVLFMDELIDSEEDVAMLRKTEVIQNFFGSNQQVADFFNSLSTGIILDEGCRVIDEARTGLYNYMKREYKILWNEFISAYFSKPWLVAGSIAATLLLLMTISQVVCLFIACNP